jgi:replicative DNA helicase
LKNDLINLIVLTQDYTEKELLIKKLADKLEIDFNAVRKEVERNEKYGDNAYLITSGDILQEQNSFEKRLNDWERIAWTRTGKLLGLPIPNFPILTQKIDGMQHALYLIAADTNIGKTCFLLNLAEGILQSNEKAFVLLFSIDDNINQIIPRMAALKSEIEINTIGNPKFKIEKNEDLTDTEINTLLRKREGTINKLKELSSRFAIKQQSDVKNIEEMEKYIKIYRTIAADKQLIVMVDNLHRIKVRKKLNSVREQFMYISSVLKDWKDNYQVPVIATAELKKFGEIRKPRGDDIKEAKELQYDADMTALLYTDFYNEIGKVKLEHSDGQGYFKPVIEFRVIKNKTSSFKGNLYYKFFPEYSKLVECTQEEMKNFRHPERNK